MDAKMDDDGVQIDVEPEVQDQDHPNTFFDNRKLPDDQANPTPHEVVDTFTQVSDFLSLYGWYILLAVIAVYYLKSRYSSRIQEWQKQRQQGNDLQRYDHDTILARQEALARARERMQDEHNVSAEEHSVRQKEREEQRRQQEIEDWEKHKAGLGYKSKLKNKTIEEPLSSPGAEGGTSRPRKKQIRDNYNPLMGAGGGSSAFRPPRRGFSGGG